MSIEFLFGHSAVSGCGRRVPFIRSPWPSRALDSCESDLSRPWPCGCRLATAQLSRCTSSLGKLDEQLTRYATYLSSLEDPEASCDRSNPCLALSFQCSTVAVRSPSISCPRFPHMRHSGQLSSTPGQTGHKLAKTDPKPAKNQHLRLWADISALGADIVSGGLGNVGKHEN